MAGNHFRVSLGPDQNGGEVKKTASIYYGPCRKSEDLTANEMTTRDPRELLKKHGLKPEPNYILLGEVEKELKAVKEKTQKVEVKHPHQLNVSNLLEELVSSKKWQILNSSNQIYGGTKRPAPQAPTQQHHHIHGRQIGPAVGKPHKLSKVSSNVTPCRNNTTHNSEAPQKATLGFDEYLNAAEVQKLWQSENKCTYDTIKLSEQSATAETYFPVPVYSTSPLAPPSLPPITRLDGTTNKTSSRQNISSDNFLLQSRHEVEKSLEIKRSETSGFEETIKLLPSDIRKHRYFDQRVS